MEADLQQVYGVDLLAVWKQRSTRWLLVRLRGLYSEDTRTRRALAASSEHEEMDEEELDEEESEDDDG